jgi:tetratricopeptide (TPR) repeat protein
MKILLPSLIMALAFAGCSSAPSRPSAAGNAVASGPVIQPPSPALAELLAKMKAAYQGGNDEMGLSLAKQAIALKGNDVSAMDRIGSAYFSLGRNGDALTIWTRALAFENDNSRRRELGASIIAIRRAVDAPAPAPANPAPVPLADAARAQSLAQSGAEFYAAGLYFQAADALLRARDLDAGNPAATRTLKLLKLSP